MSSSATDLATAARQLLTGNRLDAAGLREALLDLYELWLTGKAAEIGITEGSVRTLRSKARKALQEKLKGKLDKSLEREQHWLARGVTARRARNEGRLARLMDMRRAKAERLRLRFERQ